METGAPIQALPPPVAVDAGKAEILEKPSSSISSENQDVKDKLTDYNEKSKQKANFNDYFVSIDIRRVKDPKTDRW